MACLKRLVATVVTVVAACVLGGCNELFGIEKLQPAAGAAALDAGGARDAGPSQPGSVDEEDASVGGEP